MLLDLPTPCWILCAPCLIIEVLITRPGGTTLVSTGVFSRWMPFVCAMFAEGSTCPSVVLNGSGVAQLADCLFLLPVLRRKSHAAKIAMLWPLTGQAGVGSG